MRFYLPFCLLFILFSSACQRCPETNPPGLTDSQVADTIFPIRVDSFTIRGERHYVDGYEPNPSPEGMGGPWVSVVVEIPTGSTEKWEVDKKTGLLKWEIEDGKPRRVKYLGYPGNYGMIPGTILPKEKGGDGDPLDVIVLGPPLERGEVVMARVVGVLKLLDRGEQDDKLIAIKAKTPFEHVHTMEGLRRDFNGVLEIVETWFSNYKGPGKMKSRGYGDETEALAILESALMERYSPEAIGKALEEALAE